MVRIGVKDENADVFAAIDRAHTEYVNIYINSTLESILTEVEEALQDKGGTWGGLIDGIKKAFEAKDLKIETSADKTSTADDFKVGCYRIVRKSLKRVPNSEAFGGYFEVEYNHPTLGRIQRTFNKLIKNDASYHRDGDGDLFKVESKESQFVAEIDGAFKDSEIDKWTK